jgi:hypothetical protein
LIVKNNKRRVTNHQNTFHLHNNPHRTFEEFDKTKPIGGEIPIKINATRNTFTNSADELPWFAQERTGGERNRNKLLLIRQVRSFESISVGSQKSESVTNQWLFGRSLGMEAGTLDDWIASILPTHSVRQIARMVHVGQDRIRPVRDAHDASIKLKVGDKPPYAGKPPLRGGRLASVN